MNITNDFHQICIKTFVRFSTASEVSAGSILTRLIEDKVHFFKPQSKMSLARVVKTPSG